jgi:hypothetical protein
MSPPLPPCESSGLIDLCGVGAFLSSDWFTLQVSNLVWFLVLVALIVLAIAIPFPARAVDFSGYEQPGGDGGDGGEATPGATTGEPPAVSAREA